MTTTAGTVTSKVLLTILPFGPALATTNAQLHDHLLLSQGVPMLLAGDELCHSQQGNNNTYCQDNELTWLNWELTEEQQAWYEFVRSLTHLRHPTRISAP